ncbi:MAG: hypothetical protein R2849_14875 [Thermomicrobiales bacterium]
MQVSRSETLEDTAKVVSRYAEVFVIRTAADATTYSSSPKSSLDPGHQRADRRPSPVPEHRRHHDPAPALGHLREQAGLRRPRNVAHSLVEACALSGIDITIASPEDYQFDPSIIANAKAIAAENGGSITVTIRSDEAVKGAHMTVYTDAWISMGDAEAKWSLQVSGADAVPRPRR